MNKTEFQKNFSGELKTYLDTSGGNNLILTLGGMRPPYEFPKEEHLLAENRGAIRGYELCLRNIMALCAPPQVETVVEANYGITSSKEENPKP